MIEKLNVPWDSRWKEIPEFPTYWISQYGQVFSMRQRELINPYHNAAGYPSVKMYNLTGFYRGVPKLVREIHG
jgi:hypothetical protein